MCGHETGRWKGHQPFFCKRDLACFVDVETIMLEEDFDMDAERAKKKQRHKNRINNSETQKFSQLIFICFSQISKI